MCAGIETTFRRVHLRAGCLSSLDPRSAAQPVARRAFNLGRRRCWFRDAVDTDCAEHPSGKQYPAVHDNEMRLTSRVSLHPDWPGHSRSTRVCRVHPHECMDRGGHGSVAPSPASRLSSDGIVGLCTSGRISDRTRCHPRKISGGPVQCGRWGFPEQRLIGRSEPPEFPDAVICCDLRDGYRVMVRMEQRSSRQMQSA